MHYFQASSTSNNNNIFLQNHNQYHTYTHLQRRKKPKQNKTQKTPPIVCPTDFINVVLFLVAAMSSLKEAFQNLIHHPVANYN